MMNSAILVRPGVIELREFPIPKPAPGEILVRIKASLTCGTDLKAFRRGHLVIPMPGPFGHEFSGIVSEVGKAVRRFREGDEIMAVHSAPCLACRYCARKLFNLCENIMQTKILGAFSEYILLPPHIVKQNAFHKPRHLSFEEAALLEPLACVVHGMASLHMEENNRALVIGSGPIGLLHLLLLKEREAHVTVIDKNKDRLKVAKKLGADHIRIPGEKELQDNFMGFDYVFECTGIPGVWESSVRYLRRGGTVVLFGGCKSGTTVVYDTGRLHYDEITLRGTFHYTPADVKKAYGLLRARKINLSSLISGRFRLKDIQKVFNLLSQGKGIKYAVIP
jgi:L-iditol 2-dehydrogenase